MRFGAGSKKYPVDIYFYRIPYFLIIVAALRVRERDSKAHAPTWARGEDGMEAGKTGTIKNS